MSCVEVSLHGGQCCGIRHIHDFFPEGKGSQKGHLSEVDEAIEDCIKEAPPHHATGGECGKLLEIVLTDAQIQGMPILVKGLKKRGFKLVSRFLNSSGGWCNVLHYRRHNPVRSSPWHKVGKDNA